MVDRALLVSLLLSASALSTQICTEEGCPMVWVRSIQQGDGICDLSCDSRACGFDGALVSASGLDYTTSDCYERCVSALPDSSILGNNVCEGPPLDSEECGWDAGDCGYCAQNCMFHSGFESDLGDGTCTEACSTLACAWDGGDCVSNK